MSPHPLGSPDRPLRVAVIGAGPSGFYTAAALIKQDEVAVTVDLFDRLPTPYGLVRYGVAPDHQKIKLVERVFAKAAMDDRVRFFGHVAYPRDLDLDDLLALYDQVVFSVGAQADRQLGIPGEDLAGSCSSTEFVAWYNGHPDFTGLRYPLHHRCVAVVGIGNVAVDVVRILAKSADDLATTDIADYALEELRKSQVETIHLLARRGPAQAKCSPQELKELTEIEGAQLLVDPADLLLDPESEKEVEADRSTAKVYEILQELARQEREPGKRHVHLHFLASPVELLEEDGAVAGVRIEHNTLRLTPSGYLAAEGTGRFETLPATLVIRAAGYRSLPLPRLPFDDRRAVIPNRGGRVVDPATDEPLPRLYVVGWIKRGPQGLIGSNKADAAETVALMLADVPAQAPAPDGRPEAIEELLEERGVRYVPFAQWQRLDELEQARGKACGRPRVKLLAVAEMLAALDGEVDPG